MSDNPRLHEIGEFGLIERLSAIAGRPTRAVVGIGDDAAVIDQPGDRYLLATVDALVDGVHFRSELVRPLDLGRRLLAVSLSDIAAMGGSPTVALCSLAVPSSTSLGFLEDVYRGIRDEGERFGVELVGGNVTRTGGPLVLDLTLLGEVPKSHVVLRGGARVGDLLAVTGTLGRAASLRLAQEQPGAMPAAGLDVLGYESWVPEPRLSEGRALVSAGLVHAMLDISDGLAGDLHHLTKSSGVGAVVEQDRLPVSEAAKAVAPALALDPWELALTGGEDYELLMALPLEDAERAQRAVRPTALHMVGRVVPASQGVRLRRADGTERELRPTGWTHF